MAIEEPPVLVIGATGFVGKQVAAALLEQGAAVRALVRTPAKARSLAADGVELIPGDMLDPVAVGQAVDGVSAVVVCVHTISRQVTDRSQGFMDVEALGLENVAAACAASGVKRVMYVTSIGVAEHAGSSWLRGRWATEQALFSSGLDVTVLRPGLIVGRGGDGFGIVNRGATTRFTLAIAARRQKFRTVAVGDLARDIVDLIDRPDSAGKALDVGSDDVLTMREMSAIVAESLQRRPGRLVFIPAGLIRLLAPVVERIAKVPRGAISGFVGDGPREDMTGDPTALREILGRADRPFREAIVGQVG